MSSVLTFAAVVTIAAFLGSRFKPGQWYRELAKPVWNPPDWVFGPVWLVLYVFIALAGWLVWWANADAWSLPLTLWSLQLVLNAGWSWLFFRRHAMKHALLASGMLLVAVVGFVATAPAYSPAAAWLFIPYAAWVGFATFLTYTLWKMNPVKRVQDERGPVERIVR